MLLLLILNRASKHSDLSTSTEVARGLGTLLVTIHNPQVGKTKVTRRMTVSMTQEEDCRSGKMLEKVLQKTAAGGEDARGDLPPTGSVCGHPYRDGSPLYSGCCDQPSSGNMTSNLLGAILLSVYEVEQVI